MATFSEKEPRQRTVSHLSGCQGENPRITVEALNHLLCSPDLDPSDFFLLPHLKIELGGQRFSSNEEAIPFLNNYFAEKKRRVLFGRVTEMGASLGEVCRVTRTS
ncbi:hypothetical protein TNCV_3404531 [Trichonephila clavipes]|nr:hypothetical protein TNCV_3404531 [Trichonephila clavipes]